MEYEEIVIKIPKKVYKAICDKNALGCAFVHIDDIKNIIRNGTPLPEGHGRLVDADAFERRCMFDSDIEDMQDVIYALRDYKPVIEAESEEDK